MLSALLHRLRAFAGIAFARMRAWAALVSSDKAMTITHRASGRTVLADVGRCIPQAFFGPRMV